LLQRRSRLLSDVLASETQTEQHEH
jgi:hypothetical protein